MVVASGVVDEEYLANGRVERRINVANGIARVIYYASPNLRPIDDVSVGYGPISNIFG
jgi:hypothetical protein